jgi:hypothetical protein
LKHRFHPNNNQNFLIYPFAIVFEFFLFLDHNWHHRV